MILTKSDELQYCFKVKMALKYGILREFNRTNWKNTMDVFRDDLTRSTHLTKNFVRQQMSYWALFESLLDVALLQICYIRDGMSPMKF